MNKRDYLRVDASMEGERVIVRNIGQKRLVSDMELVVLANMARIGMLSVLVEDLDGEICERTLAALEEIKAAIREEFSHGDVDGLDKLAQSCAAMLGGERFRRYLVDG